MPEELDKSDKKTPLMFILKKELMYLGFCLVIGLFAGLEDGIYVGAKVVLLSFLVIQPLMIYINREIISLIVYGDSN